MKRFAVIGLGRFGSSVARALAQKEQEVIAIDNDEELVQGIMGSVNKAVCLDSTDESSMRAIGVQNVDVAICAIGTDIEASILVTLLLKELGVPKIVSKAISVPHSKVLKKIGATRVVQPEWDMGVRLANSLVSIDENIIDHIELPGNASIIEFVAPKDFIGKTLRDINIRERSGVNIIAIKKKKKDPSSGETVGGDVINVSPLADDVVNENDVLVVFGEDEKIYALRNKE